MERLEVPVPCRVDEEVATLTRIEQQAGRAVGLVIHERGIRQRDAVGRGVVDEGSRIAKIVDDALQLAESALGADDPVWSDLPVTTKDVFVLVIGAQSLLGKGLGIGRGSICAIGEMDFADRRQVY
jgi:hypothetical protein